MFGFEKEYFVTKDDKFVRCPYTLPHDECMYLAEARSEPYDNPHKAAISLAFEEHRITSKAIELGCSLVVHDTLKLGDEFPAKLFRDLLRENGKDPVPQGRGNVYRSSYDDKDFFTYVRAGLHIHFSHKPDIPNIVFALDDKFASEIKVANRIPGMYEMKPHGWEYRSLPASVDVVVIADFLATL